MCSGLGYVILYMGCGCLHRETGERRGEVSQASQGLTEDCHTQPASVAAADILVCLRACGGGENHQKSLVKLGRNCGWREPAQRTVEKNS